MSTPFPTRRWAALLASCVAVAAVATLASPAARSSDQPDPSAIARIEDEGLRRSQAMDTLSYLSDVYGSRLTNSPAQRAAAEWAVERMKGWQLEQVHLEPWGAFGRGWSNDRFVALVTAPTPWPLTGAPKAWTPGTPGPIRAEAALVVIDGEDEFPKWTGKLSGKIVLASRERSVRPAFEAIGRRHTDAELEELARQPPLTGARARNYGASGRNFGRQLLRFFAREGVVAVIEPGPGVGDHGSLLVMGDADGRHPDSTPSVPQVVIATEQYGRLVRTLERHVPVRLELDVRNRFYDTPLEAANVVAEIPGTDKAGEVVMLGAHLDSWHAGTGATDNAVGVAATMEAMRILKATGLPMRRTVRVALWTGEEQGLLGSTAYVARHFGDPSTMTLKPEHATLSAYFNLDNGAGAIRGVYLEQNEGVRPIFSAWMAAFGGAGMKTLAIRGTGGTDHVPFDDMGLPAFQFIQDPLEYFTFSHHSNMDLYERVPADDTARNAVLIASFVYQTATRDERLPRKALPMPAATPGSAK